ncbi:MAG: tRNA lysidine(34) synthetase TilS [Clostridiales bacterium]
MENKIRKFIDENKIMGKAKTVVIGVSGGGDSMALADFMVKNYSQYQFTFAHINHCLRPQAHAEEVLVKEFAAKLGVEFQCLKIDVAALAKQRKTGLEETGRDVRYEFFNSLNKDLILTAHHKDDRAETIIAHIIRGCGIKGLGGMKPLQNGVGRPLLCVTKAEILNYCEEHDIEYAEDISNEDTTFQRNKIRHEVLPLLATMNSNITDSLCRLGDIATEDDDFLDSFSQVIYDKVVISENGEYILSNKILEITAKSVNSRVIGKICAEIGCPLDFNTVQKILGLKTGKELPLGKMGKVRQNGTGLVFSLGCMPKVKEWSVALPKEGTVFIEPCNFKIEISQSSALKANKKTCAVFDSEDIVKDLTIRNWRKGDWFYLESGGRKKISDFFINEKIPRERRLEIPLLAMGDQIIWIVGYRQCLGKGKSNLTLAIKL